MAEMGTKPDSESKIWRLTGFGSGFLALGTGFEVNFFDSAHLQPVATGRGFVS